jgi:hypothetical protein
MRNRLPFLLFLPAMILASACMAQARDGALHQDKQAAEPAHEETPHRSAFGRVMAVMIDALQQEALQQEARRDAQPRTAPKVRTTAIGTPLGIEVGGAFRLDAQPQSPESNRTGAANASMPLAAQAGHAD